MAAATPAPAAPTPGAALSEAARGRSGAAAPLAPQAAKASAAAAPRQWDQWLRAAHQDADDPAWPMTATQRRVLRALAQAPEPPGLAWQWQAGSPPPSDPSTRELRLQHAAGAQGEPERLRIEPTGVRWLEGQRHWFAALDAATLQALLRQH